MSKFSTLLLSQQKLGTLLENQVLQKLKFSKNVNNEKCPPKIILFHEILIILEIKRIDFENQNFAVLGDYPIVIHYNLGHLLLHK
jgi:hypothetical protein